MTRISLSKVRSLHVKVFHLLPFPDYSRNQNNSISPRGYGNSPQATHNSNAYNGAYGQAGNMSHMSMAAPQAFLNGTSSKQRNNFEKRRKKIAFFLPAPVLLLIFWFLRNVRYFSLFAS
jgi:hypothetical protein